jgi:hypothetical protein
MGTNSFEGVIYQFLGATGFNFFTGGDTGHVNLKMLHTYSAAGG